MENNFSELYQKFLDIVASGDEAGAKQFLFDSFKEFPQEVQDKLTLAFFEQSLHAEAGNVEAIADMQKQAMEAMAEVEKAEKVQTLKGSM